VWTIVVGGGSGERFGRPKQYEDLGGTRVIDHAVAAARARSVGVVVVVPEPDAADEGAVAGGSTRAESVRNGLAEVPDDATVICVHDAARPLATPSLFDAVVQAVLDGADAAVPGLPVTDTIKVVLDGTVVETPDRTNLVAVQTPQAFRAEVLRSAHARAVPGGGGADGPSSPTDDASLVECDGGRVVVVPGEANNRKITAPEDLEWARSLLEAAAAGSAPVEPR
jgi:2-C-methyl-D-erythritol 4-phosphate cytidylyltransferase